MACMILKYILPSIEFLLVGSKLSLTETFRLIAFYNHLFMHINIFLSKIKLVPKAWTLLKRSQLTIFKISKEQVIAGKFHRWFCSLTKVSTSSLKSRFQQIPIYNLNLVSMQITRQYPLTITMESDHMKLTWPFLEAHLKLLVHALNNGYVSFHMPCLIY